MALIEWTDEFSVGIEAVDEQHLNLISIINKFEEARQKSKGTRIMTQILNDILGYTQEHFAYEEKLLTEAGYADLSQHQSQHRQLLQKIERLQFEFMHEGRRITAEVGELFRYWLSEHILQHDKAYAEALKKDPVES
jgi:hemerythrin-like metal-binding protein